MMTDFFYIPNLYAFQNTKYDVFFRMIEPTDFHCVGKKIGHILQNTVSAEVRKLYKFGRT